MYKKLLKNIYLLKKDVPNFAIGKSVCGQKITCFKLGSGNPKIIIQCAIHAREYITSFMAIKHIKFLHNFKFKGTIYYIPCMNPDGVRLCMSGIKSTPKKYWDSLLKLNKSADFKLFKANINGVDLNTNFDARWGFGSQNIGHPSFANFIGYSPNSQPEIRALIKWTNKIEPDLTLSYHSKGEVIYYGFNSKLSDRNKQTEIKYLNIISNCTGYKPVKTKNSTGGYKDWCVLKKDIPAYTIEVGEDLLSHPIGIEELDAIYQKNKYLPLALLKVLL